MRNLLLLFFGIFAFLDLYFTWSGISYRGFTKPLCMVFLILYALQHISFYKDPFFFISMVFAFLGDTFLLGESSLYFILGLSSFLLMQIGYGICFYKQKAGWHKSHLVLLIILIVYIILFNTFIGNYVNELKIPVLIYSIAIAWMVLTGFLRNVQIPGYNFLVLGVMLFFLSDSLLAINKFVVQISQGGFFVMLSYLLGQFFIVKGYLSSHTLPINEIAEK